MNGAENAKTRLGCTLRSNCKLATKVFGCCQQPPLSITKYPSHSPCPSPHLRQPHRHQHKELLRQLGLQQHLPVLSQHGNVGEHSLCVAPQQSVRALLVEGFQMLGSPPLGWDGQWSAETLLEKSTFAVWRQTRVLSIEYDYTRRRDVAVMRGLGV